MAVQTPPDALLDAAAAVFARHGYAGATGDRIAEAAGLSRVTLHRHGWTKERLLEALAARATGAYRDAMWAVLTSPGSGRDRLEAALAALCDMAEDHLSVLVALRAHTDSVFHEDTEEPLTRTVFTEPLERLLLDGAADGTLRTVDPLETATVLFNLVGWTYVHLRTGHRWPPARARAAVLDLALEGLRPAVRGN